MVRHPATGKYRRTRLFVLTLGYSRKCVRLLVWQSSAQVWAELHERAFRRLGGRSGSRGVVRPVARRQLCAGGARRPGGGAGRNAAIFDELEIDVEVPELRADMTEEDAAVAAAQLADELRRAEENHAAEQTARHGKRVASQRSGPPQLAAAEGHSGRGLPAAGQGAASGPRARPGGAREEKPHHAECHRRARPRRSARATAAEDRVASSGGRCGPSEPRQNCGRTPRS
jgi:hypothetical protein